MEGFAFQYLEKKNGNYGNTKNRATKKKNWKFRQKSFDENGPKHTLQQKYLVLVHRVRTTCKV